MSEGLVLFGVNNIFTVLSDRRRYLCRIKGKVLVQEESSYNPLAPGDIVEFTTEGSDEGNGLILQRKERRNSFVRWNRKKEAPQTVAANVDRIVCVGSLGVPPFRPRFIDRVLVAAAGIPAAVVVNKNDLAPEGWEEERIEGYGAMGYRVLRTSAETGGGIDALAELLEKERCVLIGQSGVGKSSLLGCIVPDAGIETGEVSTKYKRGRHTTKTARLIFSGAPAEERFSKAYIECIDTPGIRRMEPAGIDAEELDQFFPDFLPYIHSCTFSPCSHRREPGCRVKEEVERGTILADRYESYLRLYEELEGRSRYG